MTEEPTFSCPNCKSDFTHHEDEMQWRCGRCSCPFLVSCGYVIDCWAFLRKKKPSNSNEQRLMHQPRRLGDGFNGSTA